MTALLNNHYHFRLDKQPMHNQLPESSRHRGPISQKRPTKPRQSDITSATHRHVAFPCSRHRAHFHLKGFPITPIRHYQVNSETHHRHLHDSIQNIHFAVVTATPIHRIGHITNHVSLIPSLSTHRRHLGIPESINSISFVVVTAAPFLEQAYQPTLCDLDQNKHRSTQGHILNSERHPDSTPETLTTPGQYLAKPKPSPQYNQYVH